jgi:phosphate transport system substrate-binding protein
LPSSTNRRSRTHRRRLVVCTLGAFGLLAASGCTARFESIVVSGSSTVEPISISVSEKWVARNDDAQIVVDGPGTGDGFELFCDGVIDVNDASSRIKPEQEESCAASGVEFIELQIGNDGIALMTHAGNDRIDCLNFADLYALLGPESRGVDRWSDAGELAAELGSDTDLPDARLDIFGPGEESGTFSSFVELVIEEHNEARGQDATTRPDYQSSSDDNVIIQGIQGADTSLGWVGYAFAHEATGARTIPIAAAPGDECVAPSSETIADGTYPVARPLFIYVNKARAAENASLTSWVDYYLSDEGQQSVSEVGYVSLAPAQLDETRRIWAARETGAHEPFDPPTPRGQQ